MEGQYGDGYESLENKCIVMVVTQWDTINSTSVLPVR